MTCSTFLYRVAAASLVLLGTAVYQVADAQEEYVPKARVNTLYQDALPGIEGKEIIIKHMALDPGYVGGKHIHTGPVFVYVLEGELTVEIGGELITFGAGQLYPEHLDSVMQGKNTSASDDLELLVIQVSDIGDPMMIKVE